MVEFDYCVLKNSLFHLKVIRVLRVLMDLQGTMVCQGIQDCLDRRESLAFQVQMVTEGRREILESLVPLESRVRSTHSAHVFDHIPRNFHPSYFIQLMKYK